MPGYTQNSIKVFLGDFIYNIKDRMYLVDLLKPIIPEVNLVKYKLKNQPVELVLNENESELNEKSVEFDVEEKLLLKDKDSLLTSISNKKFLEGYNSDDKEMLASVYNGSCSSCYTNLPAQALVDAQKGVELIECPSCSIFLYFDEDR